jgi:hypothetical protein
MSFRSLESSYPGDVATPMNLRHNAYIVPIDKSLGFSSLTHATPYNSTLYFNINNAYSKTPYCTTFAYRACSSNDIQPTPVMYVDSIIRPKS